MEIKALCLRTAIRLTGLLQCRQHMLQIAFVTELRGQRYRVQTSHFSALKDFTGVVTVTRLGGKHFSSRPWCVCAAPWGLDHRQPQVLRSVPHSKPNLIRNLCNPREEVQVASVPEAILRWFMLLLLGSEMRFIFFSSRIDRKLC